MGMHLPGPGSIYMQQQLNFRAPVYVDEEVTATVKVMDFDTVKGNITFETVVRVGDRVAINGKALGRNLVVRFKRDGADGEPILFEPVGSRK